MRSGMSEHYSRAIDTRAEVSAESIYEIIVALNVQGEEVADGLIHDLIRVVTRRHRGTWSPAQLIALHTIADSRPNSATWKRHLPPCAA